MKFEELAQYLQKLEGTASRNEMTVTLAELFKKASPEDGKLIAYLSQGRLGPLYANPQFQVADKMMLRALGDEALELFKKVGDLGLVAQQLGQGRGNLTVHDVFQKLLEITQSSGKDSQEKKISLIKSLLDNLDPLSAKYVTRIILGKMRTGFSDMTVLDSLSWMLTGDKSQRKDIERMYNVRADLGEIVESVKKSGKSTEVKPEINTPILMARAERATTSAEIWKRLNRCAVEYKLDGLRIQAHIFHSQVKLFSRGLEDVTAMYPDVVGGLVSQIKTDCVVEGEMIAVDSSGNFLPFQETTQRKRKYNIAQMVDKIPLKLYLFDVLVLEGQDLLEAPNSRRWELLQKFVKEGRTVQLIERIETSSEQELEKFYDQAIAAGTEGVIAKKLDGPYQAGSRDFNWIKYKKSYSQSALSDTIDAVVMGYDVGQGKRTQFGIGDFLIGVYDQKQDKYFTIAKIGTGLTDEEWRKMKTVVDSTKIDEKPEYYEVKREMFVDVWCKPKQVVEVHADEITKSPMHSSGLALRFPRLISWREKQPEDATSIDEMEKIYQTQKRQVG